MIRRRGVPPLGAATVALLVVASVASVAPVAVAGEPPSAPAPAGFSWHELEDLGAWFLRPDGWHAHRAARGGTRAWFLTREPADGAEPFRVGLTVNVPPRVEHGDPVRVARLFVDDRIARAETLRRWDAEAGPFRGQGALLRAGDTRVYLLGLAQAETGTVYLIQFESPEEEWDAAWKTGVAMLDHFVLDDAR